MGVLSVDGALTLPTALLGHSPARTRRYRRIGNNTDESSSFFGSISFVLDGTRFIGINGGPQFAFSEAVSFTVSCKDQDEVDYYWDRLTDGGEESQCGWCKDRFGLSWQIVPDRLYEPVSHPDPARATAATNAMYGMRKIVIADLEDAVTAV
jgi:predicted 3-demethylubiquinone-9 3-methyltransferase (glyoxalase superfamily)